MTPRDFCYWLQGFFELSGSEDPNRNELKVFQVAKIRNHLNLVFKHSIDPENAQGNDEIKRVLDTIHDPRTFTTTDVKINC